MDVGTGRSAEGTFPPVPQQVQAGSGADYLAVPLLTEGELPSHRGTMAKHQHDIAAAPKPLKSLGLAGVLGPKHG